MAWNDVPWEAWMLADIRPLSCCGKKPFGTSANRYQLSPIVMNRMVSVIAQWRSAQPRLRS